VREVVWGYRGEEKPRFASSGFSSPLCSATSGAGILKTQVFKKTMQKVFCKKRKKRENFAKKNSCRCHGTTEKTGNKKFANQKPPEKKLRQQFRGKKLKAVHVQFFKSGQKFPCDFYDFVAVFLSSAFDVQRHDGVVKRKTQQKPARNFAME
jgi:hypothetical protein